MKIKSILLTIKNTIALLLCVSLAAAGIYAILTYRYQPIRYSAAGYTESSSSLSNPYCGFYHLYGYTLSEKTTDDAKDWCSKILKQDENQLVLLEINLNQYSGKTLTTNALAQLDCILKSFSDSNKQMILRFLYDWDGKGLTSEPKNISQIEEHMNQVLTYVNRYAGHVYILQGNFTGSYGEMNSTNFGSDEDFIRLMSCLFDTADSQIFLSVRTPAQWRSIFQTYEPLNDASAYTQSVIARVGLFNDGLLGSETDTGTYDTTALEYEGDYSEKGMRSEELAFQNRLCSYVPNGGEVITDNSYNDFENAIADLSTMHISYLNMDYDSKVLDKWKSSTYSGNDVFSSVSGYDYIAAHLGYRYVVRSSEMHFQSLIEETAEISFTVENTGFAPAYRTFDSNLLLVSEADGTTTTIPVTFSSRKLLSGETCTVSTSVDVRSLQKGDYQIVFSLTDTETESAILFANEGLNTEHGVLLGTLTIK